MLGESEKRQVRINKVVKCGSRKMQGVPTTRVDLIRLFLHSQNLSIRGRKPGSYKVARGKVDPFRVRSFRLNFHSLLPHRERVLCGHRLFSCTPTTCQVPGIASYLHTHRPRRYCDMAPARRNTPTTETSTITKVASIDASPKC